MMNECLPRSLHGYSFARVEMKNVRIRNDCSRPCWVQLCLVFVLFFVWLPLGTVSLRVESTMERQGSTWLQTRHHCRSSLKLARTIEGSSEGKALAFSEKAILCVI